MNRIIKLVVALVLATSGFLVAAGSVSAAQATTAHRAVRVTTSDAALAAADRSAVMKFKQKGNVTFKMWVKVSPAGGRKPAKLQYSKKVDGKYRTVRKAKQNSKGVAKFGTFRARIGFYRVSVPRTKNYTRTLSSNLVEISPDDK